MIYLADRLVSLHMSPTCFYPSDVGTQQNIVSTWILWAGLAMLLSNRSFLNSCNCSVIQALITRDTDRLIRSLDQQICLFQPTTGLSDTYPWDGFAVRRRCRVAMPSEYMVWFEAKLMLYNN